MKCPQIIIALVAALVVLLAPSTVAGEMTQHLLSARKCSDLVTTYYAAGIDDDQALADALACASVPEFAKNNFRNVPIPTVKKVSLPVLAHSTAQTAELPSVETLLDALQTLREISTSYNDLHHRLKGNLTENLPVLVEYLFCSTQASKDLCVGAYLTFSYAFRIQNIYALSRLAPVFSYKAMSTSWHTDRLACILESVIAIYPDQHDFEEVVVLWSKYYRWFYAYMDLLIDMLDVELLDTAPATVNEQAIIHRSV